MVDEIKAIIQYHHILQWLTMEKIANATASKHEEHRRNEKWYQHLEDGLVVCYKFTRITARSIYTPRLR